MSLRNTERKSFVHCRNAVMLKNPLKQYTFPDVPLIRMRAESRSSIKDFQYDFTSKYPILFVTRIVIHRITVFQYETRTQRFVQTNVVVERIRKTTVATITIFWTNTGRKLRENS